MKTLTTALCLLIVVLASVLETLFFRLPEMSAAPAPFPSRTKKRTKHLSTYVRGKWIVYWGDTKCQMTFSKGGLYACNWMDTPYSGSWGVDHRGFLWITESCRPGEGTSWMSYQIKFDAATMTGSVVSGPSPVSIRLEVLR